VKAVNKVKSRASAMMKMTESKTDQALQSITLRMTLPHLQAGLSSLRAARRFPSADKFKEIIAVGNQVREAVL